MGDLQQPQPVKHFTGILSSRADLLPEFKKRLISEFGDIDYQSEEYVFDLTNYYEPEMGSGIKRWFWSFHRLIDPIELVDIKLFTNELELSFADDNGNRPVNLDPGYLDFYKMVLASVKDRAQKIYLGKGIYADPTLFYLKGKWYHYDWSLQDFKLELYHPVFQQIRVLYRENMRNQVRR